MVSLPHIVTPQRAGSCSCGVSRHVLCTLHCLLSAAVIDRTAGADPGWNRSVLHPDVFTQSGSMSECVAIRSPCILSPWTVDLFQNCISTTKQPSHHLVAHFVPSNPSQVPRIHRVTPEPGQNHDTSPFPGTRTVLQHNPCQRGSTRLEWASLDPPTPEPQVRCLSQRRDERG